MTSRASRIGGSSADSSGADCAVDVEDEQVSKGMSHDWDGNTCVQAPPPELASAHPHRWLSSEPAQFT